MAGRSGKPHFTVRLDCWIFLDASLASGGHPLGKIREKFARIMVSATETAFAANAAGRRAAASAAGRNAG